MLSKNKVVKARKAIESLYDGKCTVTVHQKVKKANKTTAFTDVDVLIDIPCRVSYKTTTTTNPMDTASNVVQITKVFLAPEHHIQPGSKLTVTQNNVTTEYKSSGEPAYYATHQEVVVELFKGWA